MYFYIDESGQTGLNLFDESQPFLYYGILRSKLNLDVLAEKSLKPLWTYPDTLHAEEPSVRYFCTNLRDVALCIPRGEQP